MPPVDISDEVSSAIGRRIQPTFGYYRQPNGWITISPSTQMDRMKYTEEGWTYLEAYGTFDMTAYTAGHPFEGLFMFGGAKEMPTEQVLQTGLYIDPPLVPTCKQHLTQYHRAHTRECWRRAEKVEFPQLAKVPKELIGPFVCDFCQRKLPTPAAREQHQSVAHAKPLGDVRLGRALGDTLSGVLGQQQAAPDDGEKEALRQRVADLEAERAKTQENRDRMAKARAKRKSKV